MRAVKDPKPEKAKQKPPPVAHPTHPPAKNEDVLRAIARLMRRVDFVADNSVDLKEAVEELHTLLTEINKKFDEIHPVIGEGD